MYVVLADDQALVREALSASLTKLFNFDVLQAKDAGEAVQLTRKHNPVLVIMDLMMPGMDTFEAASKIQVMAPYTKLLLLTGRADVDLCFRAREQKIHGYALKGEGQDELKYAINTVMKGGIYIPPSISEHLYDPGRRNRTALDGLTQKEKSVLSLIAQGMSMREISKQMDITVKTVETHRNNLGRKLGHPNRAQIFAFAMQHGMVDAQSLAITA